MTEEEAKTKWCPHVRHVDDDSDAPCNRYREQGVRPWNACLGSGCMAWRWEETAEFKIKADAEFRHSGQRIVTTEGYCGLAGKP